MKLAGIESRVVTAGLLVASLAGFTMMVLRPGAGGRFDIVETTHDVFTTDVPYPVTIDLPTLTAEWNETWEGIRSRNLGAGEDR